MTAFYGILLPFFGTVMGAGCVFFLKRSLGTQVQRALTGFAAGVMVAASIWSLLIPSMEQAADMGKGAVIPAAAGFWLGILFLLILDRLIPHQHRNADHVWIRRDDGAGCRVGIKISVLPHKFFCQMERKKRIGLESKNITHCYSHFNSSARRPYGDWRR